MYSCLPVHLGQYTILYTVRSQYISLQRQAILLGCPEETFNQLSEHEQPVGKTAKQPGGRSADQPDDKVADKPEEKTYLTVDPVIWILVLIFVHNCFIHVWVGQLTV